MEIRTVTREASAIRTVIESWYRAMQDGDVDRLISLVTRDVIVKPPGVTPITGRSALHGALSAFLKEQSEAVDYEIQEVEVCGQLAFARIFEHAAMRPRSGADAFTVSGIHLTILRRQPDGEWLVARDISSLIDTT